MVCLATVGVETLPLADASGLFFLRLRRSTCDCHRRSDWASLIGSSENSGCSDSGNRAEWLRCSADLRRGSLDEKCPARHSSGDVMHEPMTHFSPPFQKRTNYENSVDC